MYKAVIASYLILNICQSISAENEGKEICQSRHGSMLLSNAESFIATIKEGSKWTVFVTDIDKYVFKCISTINTKHSPEIAFGGDDIEIENGGNPITSYGSGETIRRLEGDKLRARNTFNKRNLTITCGVSNDQNMLDRFEICTATVIVLTSKLESECEYNSTLTCDVNDINNEMKLKKNQEYDITTYSMDSEAKAFQPPWGRAGFQLTTPPSLNKSEGAIKYSIYQDDKVQLNVMSLEQK